MPADGASSNHFNNTALISLLTLVPGYLAWKVGGGFKTWVFFALILDLPILGAFWIITSEYAPRKNEKAKFPGKPIEHYLKFHKAEDREKYHGKTTILMETFYEMYFNSDVDFNGDALEILELRHDWVNFRFTLGQIKHFLTGMVPEMLLHTRSQGLSLPSLCSRFFYCEPDKACEPRLINV